MWELENTSSGLSTVESITLVGGDINLLGGEIIVPSGNITLAAVEDGEVNIVDSEQIFNVDRFGNIVLTDHSLVDVSGGGTIGFWGESVSIANGSLVIDQNFSDARPGRVSIDASYVSIEGGTGLRDETNWSISGISVYNSNSNGSSIILDSDRLILQNGGFINSHTYGSGKSGDISIRSETVEIEGFSSTGSPSIIGTATFERGMGGDIDISAKNVLIENNGLISALASGSPENFPNAGDLRIDSSERVEIRGGQTNGSPIFGFSSIASSGFNGANTGNVFVKTQYLDIGQSNNVVFLGVIAFTSGSLGQIDLQANEITVWGNNEDNFISPNQIELSDFQELPGAGFTRTSIGAFFVATEDSLSPDTRVVNEEARPTNISDLTIDVDRILIYDGAFISAINRGSGVSGNIFIDAGELILQGGGITSDLLFGGSGGDIFIDVSNVFLLEGSLISSSATGVSNGGSLQINSETITLLNSLVRANGQLGVGGSIVLDSVVLIEDDSVLEASSGLSSSLDGRVILDFETVSIEDRPFEASPVSDLAFTSICSGDLNGALRLSRDGNYVETDFVMAPINTWTPSILLGNSSVTSSVTLSPGHHFLEASHFFVNEEGKYELVAENIYHDLRETSHSCEQYEISEASIYNMK